MYDVKGHIVVKNAAGCGSTKDWVVARRAEGWNATETSAAELGLRSDVAVHCQPQ
jgi:hypothetical protein